MRPKEFEKYLKRDGGCVHCGRTETLVPHHRRNRGMGGSKSRDVPSNIVVVCAMLNFLMENDVATAKWARRMGWKLSGSGDPSLMPLYDAQSAEWVLLDDDFNRRALGKDFNADY